MIDARFRPMDDPNRTRKSWKHRKSAPFRSTYSQTLDLLESELNHLGAKDVTIQAGYRLDQIRNDGWPRANHSPSHPAVIISFRNRAGQQISFPCDTYNALDDNLRAIALSLQSLRAVDRYGVTQQGEQYKGWAQLPAADTAVTEEEKAISLLAFLTKIPAGQIRESPDYMIQAWRAAVKTSHPDTGGSRTTFDAVQAAKETLLAMFKRRGVYVG